MVIMEKKESTVFDTRDDPDPANRYVTEIDFAQRLTWGGEYIHAAPWSTGSQGYANVSHGCTGLSTANAAWLYGLARIGDVVDTTGTDRKMEWDNGFGDWNLSWAEYQKGSAL